MVTRGNAGCILVAAAHCNGNRAFVESLKALDGPVCGLFGTFSMSPNPNYLSPSIKLGVFNHLCQVGFSCLNASQLRNWYRSSFGMVGFHAADFDKVVANIAANSDNSLPAPIGPLDEWP